MAHQNCIAWQQLPELHLNVPQGGLDWFQHRCSYTRKPVRRQQQCVVRFNVGQQKYTRFCLCVCVCACIPGEVVDDAVWRFHQLVHHTLPVIVHQRNASQLISLLC